MNPHVKHCLLVLWSAVTLSVPAAAQSLHRSDAEACSRAGLPGLPDGPIGVAYGEADVATGRRACPRTEVGIGIRAGAVIDTPAFYGDLGGAAQAFGSWAVRPDTELFATLDAVRFEYAQNAVLKGTELHLGQLTAGVTHVLYARDGWVLSPSARLLVPTSTATRAVRIMGLELGLAANRRLARKLDLYGYFGVDGSLAAGNAPVSPRGGVLGNVGVQYVLCSGLGLALDVNAHLGERAVLDYVAPALGLRFAVGQRLGFQLAGSLPLVGADRHDFAGGLRVQYQL